MRLAKNLPAHILDPAESTFTYIHMFAFRLKPGVNTAQKEHIISEIGKLQGQIPGLEETRVGRNVSPRGQGYEIGGVMRFKLRSKRTERIRRINSFSAGCCR